MTSTARYAHFLLWNGDSAYRRAWFLAPQLLALVGAGWILTRTPEAPLPGWGAPDKEEFTSATADAVRDRAKTDPQALAEIRRKADAGDATAQFELATLYDPDFHFATTVTPDGPTAARYYRQSAEQGFAPSQANYANYLAYGQGGLAKSPAEAVKWAMRAVNGGNAFAERLLGDLYWNGAGAPKDRVKAVEFYRMAADQGDNNSMAYIGDAYWEGWAPYSKDRVEALKWYRKVAAAEPPNAAAMRRIGLAYRDGDGANPDRTESLAWFRRAADLGDSFAQTEIGAAYWDGLAPYAKDHVEAVNWYRKAAQDPNESVAARMMGTASRDGDGAPKNLVDALRWYRQAAEKGDTFAAGELGIGYYTGNDPYSKDYAEAVKWLKVAVTSEKESIAQRLLGICYFEGLGVEHNLAEGRKWLQQAFANGDKEAGKLLRSWR
jgi:TPR repeat protein